MSITILGSNILNLSHSTFGIVSRDTVKVVMEIFPTKKKERCMQIAFLKQITLKFDEIC